jgi:hypothetical protein
MSNGAGRKQPMRMTTNYVAVIVIEAVIIAALWWFGHVFS